MKTLFSVLFFSLLSSLPAQSPPSPFSTVGGLYLMQVGSSYYGAGYGEQQIEAHASPGDIGTATWLGNYGVKIGRRIWWLTASKQPTTSGNPIYTPTGTTAVVFGVATLAWPTPYTFPGAATNFDQVLIDPATQVIVSPFMRSTHQTSHPFTTYPGMVFPSQGFDVDWLYWDIPNNSALVGLHVGVQAVRLDGGNGLWYLSDLHGTEIVQ